MWGKFSLWHAPALQTYVRLQVMAAIGVITFELVMDDAHSLKDKRHYVKGLKERLRNRFNVATSEIGDQEILNRGLIAAVTVASSRGYAEQLLNRVEEDAALFLGPVLAGTTVEWIDSESI
jgi:uncharacterized protein